MWKDLRRARRPAPTRECRHRRAAPTSPDLATQVRCLPGDPQPRWLHPASALLQILPMILAAPATQMATPDLKSDRTKFVCPVEASDKIRAGTIVCALASASPHDAPAGVPESPTGGWIEPSPARCCSSPDTRPTATGRAYRRRRSTDSDPSPRAGRSGSRESLRDWSAVPSTVGSAWASIGTAWIICENCIQ